MKVLACQITAARGLLGWSTTDLALAADISLYQVQRLESTPGDLGPSNHLAAVEWVLAAKGVVFTRDAGRVGVALETRRR